MGLLIYKSPIRRSRARIAILLATVLALYIFRDLLVTSYLLAQTPLIWSLSPVTEELKITRDRDAFDISFKEFPEFINATSGEHAQRAVVPNIFHHILLGIKPKPGWEFARSECMRYHPDHRFEYWDDARAEKFLREEFPDYYETWMNYRYPIQKADSLRYFVMYKYGGIFLDMDLQCVRSLVPLQRFEVVTPAAHPMGVSNGFFMTTPNHPFMRDLVTHLKSFNRHWFFLPYSTVMFSTGCYYMSAIHLLQPNRTNLRLLWGPDNLHRLSGNVTTPLFKHLGSSSWHSYDAAFFNFIGKPSKWFDFLHSSRHGGLSWYMVGWCLLGLVIGLFVGRRMQRRRPALRALRRPRRTSFGTNPKQSIWTQPMYKTREQRRAVARFAAQLSQGRYWRQLASGAGIGQFAHSPPRTGSPNDAESDTSYGSETTLEGGDGTYKGHRASAGAGAAAYHASIKASAAIGRGAGRDAGEESFGLLSASAATDADTATLEPGATAAGARKEQQRTRQKSDRSI